MSFVPALIAGIGALGGLFGNRSSKQQTTGLQQSNFSNLSMPALSEEGKGVLYPTADAFLANLGKDPDLSGYRANQQQDINQLGDARSKMLNFEFNRRGISQNSPQAMAYQMQNENQRFADTTHLNNAIPLLAQQILQDKIKQGIDLFSTIPHGTYNTGGSNTAQQGEVTNPGNMLGGAFGNLGEILAYLFGQGAFGGGGGGGTKESFSV